MFCRKCGKEYEGKFCPNCGEPAAPEIVAEPQRDTTILNGVEINTETPVSAPNEPFYSKTWFILLMMCCCCFPIGLFLMWKYKKFNKPVRIIVTAFFVICFFLGVYGNLTSTPQSSTTSETTAMAAVTATKVAEAPAADVEAITETPEPIETTAAETSTEGEKIPTEYKSALNKAETYSQIMSMSKAGIYNQLTSEYGEKFSADAAQYAIDHMEADWKANALAKATTYSETMVMSKASIYDQLISEYGEQFTEEEAQYAIENVVADWKANALAKAKTYQESMNMSPSAIHDQLTSEYGEKFTKEEADYAIANLQ